MDAVDRDIVLGNQIFHHGIGALAAQYLVVLARSSAVGKAFHGDEIPLVLGGAGHHGIKVLLVLVGQHVLVESKRNGQIAHLLVVVEIRNHLSQAGDLLGVLGCQIVSLAGLAHGVFGAVLGRHSRLFRGTGGVNAVLGFFVHLLHVALSLLDLLTLLL